MSDPPCRFRLFRSGTTRPWLIRMRIHIPFARHRVRPMPRYFGERKDEAASGVMANKSSLEGATTLQNPTIMMKAVRPAIAPSKPAATARGYHRAFALAFDSPAIRTATCLSGRHGAISTPKAKLRVTHCTVALIACPPASRPACDSGRPQDTDHGRGPIGCRGRRQTHRYGLCGTAAHWNTGWNPCQWGQAGSSFLPSRR